MTTYFVENALTMLPRSMFNFISVIATIINLYLTENSHTGGIHCAEEGKMGR